MFFHGKVVGRDREEKRSGGKNRQLVREEERGAVAHRGRVPAVVSHRLPDPARRAVLGRHQPDNHQVRGGRHGQQLVHARQIVPADIGEPPSEGHAQGVPHEERGHSVLVPVHRTDRRRRRFRRRARLLSQVLRRRRRRNTGNVMPRHGPKGTLLCSPLLKVSNKRHGLDNNNNNLTFEIISDYDNNNHNAVCWSATNEW